VTQDIVENFHTVNVDENETMTVEVPEEQYEAFQPINDRVLLTRVTEDNSTKGRFIIPEKYRQASNKGTVIAVGDKVTTLQAGDIVLYGDYNSEVFIMDGTEYLIVSIHDVRGYKRPKSDKRPKSVEGVTA
jgi:chaperonin GroES